MSVSKSNAPSRLRLVKQCSWSPDILRDETWLRRKDIHRRRDRRCKSFTDDDLDELRAGFELGFRFDSPDLDPQLSNTFPALSFFHTVNQQYNQTLSRSSSSASTNCDMSSFSTIGSPSTSTSTSTIFDDAGNDPEKIKTRLRQWAQVVSCAVRQSSPN